MAMNDAGTGKETKRETRRAFLRGAAAMCAAAALGGAARAALGAMAPVPDWAERQTPVLPAGGSGKFSILQVTDLHMHYIAKGYLGTPQQLEKIKAMVEIFKPAMIMNTGDFWVNVTEPGGADTCKWLCAEFAKFGVPWAFAWGNHDESKDYNRTHRILEGAPGCLYRGAAADGNYRIAVKPQGAAAPVWNLIVLNNSRGGFRQPEIDWFEQEATVIRSETPAPPPAFVFAHIPARQYEDIAAPGKAAGVKFESVCHENGSADAVPAFGRAGFVKAMFCGHDHVNDYYGQSHGISLHYGRALGGYGEDRVRKGATLITADIAAGTYQIRSVFEDGSSVTFDTFTDIQKPGRIY